MPNFNTVDDSSRLDDRDDFTSSFPFLKVLMTALAIGISDTVLCLAYNLIYRQFSGGFFSSDLINVSSIIFGINILFLVIGVLYFAFLQAAGKGEVAFSLLFVVLTVLGVIAALQVHRSPDPEQNSRFHVLLTGVILIVGISAVGMPLVYHSRKFVQKIL